jgi:hypothetical protein
MAKMVLLASFLSINTTDVSSYTSKIDLTVDVKDEDITTFASQGWKEVIGGLKEGKLQATFKQDVAASAIDSIMWPLLGTVVPFEVRLSNTVVGASNPKYTGSLLVKQWKPISGDVGKVAEVSIDWPATGVVTRAIT